MMIIAVCDDNQADRDKIVDTIQDYLQNQQLRGKVFAYDSAENLLWAMEEKRIRFDVIFLDILMGHMSGMACARLIRRQDNLVRIAFLTSSTDYVYEGYEVNATRYLLKPINESKVIAFLEETTEQIEGAAKESILLTSSGVTRKIPIHSILYLESKKNILRLFLAQACESITLYMTLDGFQQLHSSNLWIRPHKSFLVNFLHIEEYRKEHFVMPDGVVIPISRTYKNTARESFYALLHNL